MNTGNVRGILSELQANVAKKKNDLASLENKIQECQISLNQLIEPKLQKLMQEKAEKERQVTELESLLVSKEKCRLELMDEHASALHSLKSMGESLEAMEEKIQDKKVEGIENSRYIHLHIFIFWSFFKKNGLWLSARRFWQMIFLQFPPPELLIFFRQINLNCLKNIQEASSRARGNK